MTEKFYKLEKEAQGVNKEEAEKACDAIEGDRSTGVGLYNKI